jgi:alkyl sulfatase BDS1-like metallo-beta-lactamase superfamily hydrolase
MAQQTPPQPASSKPATEATKAASAAVLQALPFADESDFEDAQRGLVGKPDALTIQRAERGVGRHGQP